MDTTANKPQADQANQGTDAARKHDQQQQQSTDQQRINKPNQQEQEAAKDRA